TEIQHFWKALKVNDFLFPFFSRPASLVVVPLRDSTVDIAVFCLSLMGTNLGDFLAEANRVLVMGGVLKIAEVASRFENERSFFSALSSLGFKLVHKDTKNSHFYSFEFIKTGKAPVNVKKVSLQLKPCLYKKR
uniref:Ribosomal RNA-processing protein 8 n=1 Tax=Cyprinus carpio TaxID=7962 RepID=A0A8C2JNR7_CYPCA